METRKLFLSHSSSFSSLVRLCLPEIHHWLQSSSPLHLTRLSLSVCWCRPPPETDIEPMRISVRSLRLGSWSNHTVEAWSVVPKEIVIKVIGRSDITLCYNGYSDYNIGGVLFFWEKGCGRRRQTFELKREVLSCSIDAEIGMPSVPVSFSYWQPRSCRDAFYILIQLYWIAFQINDIY
jgi:hypothetical protein